MLVAEWDFDVEKEVAREEGMEMGLEMGWEKGLREAHLKDAKTMRNEGIDVNTVARITGLTVNDVLKL